MIVRKFMFRKLNAMWYSAQCSYISTVLLEILRLQVVLNGKLHMKAVCNRWSKGFHFWCQNIRERNVSLTSFNSQ